MDAGSDLGSAAKGSTIDLEFAGSGPVSCCVFIPIFSLPMCSSLACLSFTILCRTSSLISDTVLHVLPRVNYLWSKSSALIHALVPQFPSYILCLIN